MTAPAAAFAACLIASIAPVHAQAVADFYRGRTIDLYIGLSAGGGYDAYGRTVARFMSEHIPGKPRIVPKNMTGAGSRTAANYMYTVAPKDGTALASVEQSIALQQALGDATVNFDASRFLWIGNPIADNNVLATFRASGILSIEDAKKREAAIGATGINTSSQYAQALNAVAGTRFKIIIGYPGGAEINLAMEKGEVAGRGSSAWSSWKVTRPEWVRDGRLVPIVQIGLAKARDLPHVPLLIDVATNEEDRAALRLLSAPPTIGRPIFTTPGVPPERVKALRDAFDATMKDPTFIEQAKKEGLDLEPVSGEELQKIVSEILTAPKPIVERLGKLIDMPDLAPAKKN